MTEAWLSLLGLARKAGKLAPGENQATSAMRRDEVFLLVLAEDAGPSLYRKYHLWAQDQNVPLVRKGTKAGLGQAIGMGPHAVVAITDEGFGERILQTMQQSSGGIILDRKRQGQNQGVRTGQGTQVGQSPSHRSITPLESGKHQKSHEHRGSGRRQDGAGHNGRQASSRTQDAREQSAASASRPHAQRGASARSDKPGAQRASTRQSQRSPHSPGGPKRRPPTS